ncbi:MAG: hypothetical protein U5J78_06900 [Parasphingorhabdus sp.]|nr:hypothetical protein [Parasphingorhabdus sp.]
MNDAGWLAHRYDESADAFRFLDVPRDVHRQSTFITDDYLPNHPDFVAIARQDAAQFRPQTVPIHFIFHSAYCCSTMLARAFDLPGIAMGLKEPAAAE